MEFSWLELRDFRSYRELRIEPDPSINVLVGANGAGKTNLLEGAAYLSALRSFRGAPDEALINDESEAAVVRGEVRHAESTSLIELELPRSGRRRVRVNGQRPARSTDLLGHVRAVMFLPDDLDIVKRGPAYRRDFLDAVAVQLWPGAYLDQQEYDRALRQRNSLLRQSGWDVDRPTLAVWDQRLSQAAGKMMVRRRYGAAAALRDALRKPMPAFPGRGRLLRCSMPQSGEARWRDKQRKIQRSGWPKPWKAAVGRIPNGGSRPGDLTETNPGSRWRAAMPGPGPAKGSSERWP